MHDPSENSRVRQPAEDQKTGKIEYGRQLAMDRIVLDECRQMMAETGIGIRGGNRRATRARRHGPSSPRRFLWVGAGLAASILGVWAILWGTGALQYEMGTGAGTTGSGSIELARLESPLESVATTPNENADPPPALSGAPTETTTHTTPPKPNPAPGNAPQDKTQPTKPQRKKGVVPDPGVKLKRLEIPKPNANGELPIPESADPEDIKLIRSAVAMFEAEAKLAKMVKAGLIQGVDRILRFDEISSWPYEDKLKGMPEDLVKLDRQKVLMTGFMLPINDVENIKEFLLVESLWSCCYGQPPDINGTVRVVLKGNNRTDYMFDPIKLVGTFRIEPTIEDGFCVDIFQLEVERVEVIE